MHASYLRTLRIGAVLFLGIFFFEAHASDEAKIAKPSQISAPRPLLDGTGQYFSPYTSDGVVTEWVNKGIELDMGANIGSLVGTGAQLLTDISLVGGIVGDMVGEKIGHEVAMSAIGGEEFVKSTSDQSFEKVEDLAVFLYARHASHRDYKEVLAIAIKLYPELKDIYYSAIVDASRQAFAFDIDLGD